MAGQRRGGITGGEGQPALGCDEEDAEGGALPALGRPGAAQRGRRALLVALLEQGEHEPVDGCGQVGLEPAAPHVDRVAGVGDGAVEVAGPVARDARAYRQRAAASADPRRPASVSAAPMASNARS